MGACGIANFTCFTHPQAASKASIWASTSSVTNSTASIKVRAESSVRIRSHFPPKTLDFRSPNSHSLGFVCQISFARRVSEIADNLRIVLRHRTPDFWCPVSVPRQPDQTDAWYQLQDGVVSVPSRPRSDERNQSYAVGRPSGNGWDVHRSPSMTGNIVFVGKLLGHRSPTTTARYMHPDISAARIDRSEKSNEIPLQPWRDMSVRIDTIFDTLEKSRGWNFA